MEASTLLACVAAALGVFWAGYVVGRSDAEASADNAAALRASREALGLELQHAVRRGRLRVIRGGRR